MRILVLCYEYPPIGGGGGRVAASIAEQLVTRGHEVRVQTAALRWRSAHETIRGVEVFRTASGRRAPDTCRVHEMALFLATSFIPTLRHVRDWQPDVIHAHFAMPTGVLAWKVHARNAVPYVLTAHLGDVPGGVPEQTASLFKITAPIARRVWRDASACTAVSSFVRDLAEKAYARPVTRIVNGIDLSGGRGSPPSLSAQRRLVFVGRFNPQKRPAFLLQALSTIIDRPWHLTVIGDGPLMPEVRRTIDEFKLHDRVHLTGWLATDEVQRVLARADILCMPSTSEGLPVAAVEALKHGLAVVGSDIPGLRDVIDDGVNGFLVESNDPRWLRAKLLFLLENESALLAMKHASWEKARAFDLRTITDQYEHVLKSAAAQPNHGA
jgi:glycosyltransferase involved in cell wall biosynthesis